MAEGEREASSKLGVLRGFSRISLQDLLPATGDGFRSEVLCFLLLGPAIVGSALWGCDLLLGLHSFPFSSFVGLLVFLLQSCPV